MNESVYDIVQRALIDGGIDVYPPSAHKGECTKKYAVLKQDGGSKLGNFSSEQVYYTLMCYVPREEYFQLEPFVAECEAVMALQPIYPMLIPTGQRTSSFFDGTINGHMVSITYRCNKRNIHV